jgi:tetratricopeptide (TPR) repeat protein
MARSAQRKNRQRRERRRPTQRAVAPIARPAPSYEDTMFFPRLRRQAKWMFVFLAVVFGLGYVIFNVGGTIPGTGLGDILQNIGQGTSGPSVSGSEDKIKDNPNDPTGYRELATALQRDGRSDEAVAPLTRYLQFRPKDRAALSTLAGIYLTQAQQAQDRAQAAQFQLQQVTGGDFFVPGQSSRFGQSFGTGQISQIEADRLNQQISQGYSEAQSAYQSATRTYKGLIAAIPNDEEADQPSIFLQLAFAAQSGGDLKEALAAYNRYLIVAPDSPNAGVVRTQVKQLKAAIKAQAAQAPQSPQQ